MTDAMDSLICYICRTNVCTLLRTESPLHSSEHVDFVGRNLA